MDMTSESPVWEPSGVRFVEQEDVMTDSGGEVISNKTISRGRSIINSLSTSEEDEVDFTDNENFFDTLNAKVNVARVVVSEGKHGVIYESLSQKLLISTEASKRAVYHTTQIGIRTILHSPLSRRFKTND